MTAQPSGRLGHLLILLPSTRFGGTEGHTLQLAARLAAQPGLRVTLAAEAALLPELAAGLPHGPAPALRAAPIGWSGRVPTEAEIAGQQAAATALVARLAPDILLIPLPWPNAGLGLLRAGAALPRLVVLHLVPEAAPAGLAEAVEDLPLEGAAWCAVSAPGARRAERFFGLPPLACAQIDNPAPPPPQADRAMVRAALRAGLGLHADAPLVLFVGRLEKGKGAHLLPGIATESGMTLACAGSGPLRPLLDRQAAADPEGRLRLLGQLADPAAWYLAADALVLPSVLEGMPLVFLEAAAAGCPVVATEAALEGLGAAAPDLARLVPRPEAAPFAATLRALLADPEGAAALAGRARAEAARRSWDRILPEWLGLLRAAATRRPLDPSPETPA
ncbi:glycosyltransferase family 4 protein [Falsiroseomonas tokyonensis]|uniref:Glycosyltransferase family 4 protein n=1 Tax=Falsiroseomonas tokyonensis TaxID=430521 RepID=A0ABV7BRD6_9PROT|nr:glycosyltransferase family 4 protein [Falsiroseomonas tokyonensis]MBU8538110.1 glycosyltransferase family 4 protein [Falsiroseomonas tokyonensis]